MRESPIEVSLLLSMALLLMPDAQAPVQAPAMATTESRPAWVSVLPAAPSRIYAVGMADLQGSESEARARASSRARVEVVARLRASVKGETVQSTQIREARDPAGQASGSGERSLRETSQVTARAEDLPGLSVEAVHVDPAARVVYALACLDAAQAKGALEARLETARNGRLRIGEEQSRKARWRVRQLRGGLGALEELSGILGAAGLLGDFPGRLHSERLALEARLASLESADLPPLDLASSTLSLRSNADLPGGIQDYLEARIKAQGPACRAAGADFILDLAFGGPSRGPEFIYSEMTFAAGVLYHLDVRLRLLDASGAELTRAAVISLTQAGTPDGLVEQFRRQFDRRMPRMLEELMAELR